MSTSPVLPGFYGLLFMSFEPLSTVTPWVMAWAFPGATWFHHQLIPSDSPAPPEGFLDERTSMAIWQLGNCYMLLGMISALVFRAVRDALPRDPIAQERIVGASLTALAIADVTHVIGSLVWLPQDILLNPASWNPMTHGNVTFTIFLFISRMLWFRGIGRTTYWYGQRNGVKSGYFLK